MVVFTKNPKETMNLGKKIASKIKKGDVIGFTGELGSGKTTMIKGIVKYLTGKEAISPSFVMINEYEGKVPVFHFDLYRISCKIDMANIGWEEYIGKGIVLIEWAEKIKDMLPVKTVFVRFHVLNGKRKIVIQGGRKNDKQRTGFKSFKSSDT
jgi:tRNA threonylcarbamoyladenosine biosynthesis protein TsaE